jgi:YhcH/YjgK/YiaL family protein
MIVDSIDQLGRYSELNPQFAAVAEFLRTHDLATMPSGIHHIQGDDLFVNIQDAPAKTREQARFETHRRMIDIQVPVSGDEEHGWCPAELLPKAEYDEAADMSLHDPVAPATNPSLATTYFTLRPGQFAIYFPSDGHAPAVTPTGLRKAIFKVKA